MRKKGLGAISADIDKLAAGRIDVPLESGKAKGGAKFIRGRLEELRLSMLAERISYEERIERFNETIAGVAHDLKTPIATIAGYAECIQDGIDDRDYPALIAEKAAKMNEQVVSLVESVRAGKSEGEKERVEARAFFASAARELKSIADKKKITLRICKIRRACLYIDKKKIARVLQNLVGNAVKATPEGGSIVLKFDIWGNFYYIRVIDKGCGIKKEDEKHVFEKFYMADKARSDGNSGLGLYIAKEFVEEHGGAIKFRTKEGKGTAFSVGLPIVPEKDVKPSTQKFEERNQLFKLCVATLFGFIMPWVFRFVKYGETRCPSTLLAAFAAIPFFLLFWATDILSELVYNKINYLAD